MANRTIGGQSPLDRLTVDDSIDITNDLLAIWNASPDLYTNSVTPKLLVDAVVKDDIDSIKKDLGGDPYTAFSIDWGKETEDKYPSIYDGLSDYTYPTSAQKEIRYIEADIKDLKDNFNDLIESLKRDLGYKPAATEGASTYYSINGKNESPDSYDSAYLWLSSLLNKIPRLGTWPSEPIVTAIKGNAYSWLSSLDSTVTDINGNFARKYWTRYWADELRHSHDILPEPYTANYPRKDYEKDTSSENQARKFYYFGLQNDGNLVLYRSKSDKHGDGPADIGNNRQWVWQTGPEYKPAIFRIIALFNIGKTALDNTTKLFTLKDAINRYNTFNAGHQIQDPLKPSYFSEVNTANDFSILSVKYLGGVNNKVAITLNDLYIDYKYLSQKIIAKITKNAETPTTIDDVTYAAQPAYIKLLMIIARDSNIPDPLNYPNTTP